MSDKTSIKQHRVTANEFLTDTVSDRRALQRQVEIRKKKAKTKEKVKKVAAQNKKVVAQNKKDSITDKSSVSKKKHKGRYF